MDISALLGGLISDKTVNEVSRKSGASKKDVARVFNAETFIVGLLSCL